MQHAKNKVRVVTRATAHSRRSGDGDATECRRVVVDVLQVSSATDVGCGIIGYCRENCLSRDQFLTRASFARVTVSLQSRVARATRVCLPNPWHGVLLFSLNTSHHMHMMPAKK